MSLLVLVDLCVPSLFFEPSWRSWILCFDGVFLKFSISLVSFCLMLLDLIFESVLHTLSIYFCKPDVMVMVFISGVLYSSYFVSLM